MGRAFLIFGVVRPAIVATRIHRSKHSSRVARPRTACQLVFHHITGGTCLSQHIALSSLAILPPGLPTGSKADASFEATGELSTWPLPFGDLALASWQKH